MFRQKLVMRGFAPPSTQKQYSGPQMAAARTYGLLLAVMLFILLWPGIALVNVAAAAHASWHEDSDRYDVHLGVVPATWVRADAVLAKAHPTAARQGGSSQHIVVTVWRKSDGKRVTEAKVFAEVIERKLWHWFNQEKPLKKMALNGMVTYCNFFDLQWNGTYKIRVRIQGPDILGEDIVVFYQKIKGLPD